MRSAWWIVLAAALAILGGCGGGAAEPAGEPQGAATVSPVRLEFCCDDDTPPGLVGEVVVEADGSDANVTLVVPEGLEVWLGDDFVNDTETVVSAGTTATFEIHATACFEGEQTIQFKTGETTTVDVVIANVCPPPATLACSGMHRLNPLPEGSEIPGDCVIACDQGFICADHDTGQVTNDEGLQYGSRLYDCHVLRDPDSGDEVAVGNGPTGAMMRPWDAALGQFVFTELIAINNACPSCVPYEDDSGAVWTNATRNEVNGIVYDDVQGRFRADVFLVSSVAHAGSGPVISAVADGPDDPIYYVTAGSPGQLWRHDAGAGPLEPSTLLVTLGNNPVSIEKLDSLLFIVNQSSDSLWVYDIDDAEVAETVDVGDVPIYAWVEDAEEDDGDGLNDETVAGLEGDTICFCEFEEDGDLTSEETMDLPPDSGPTWAIVWDDEVLVTLYETGGLLRLPIQ